MNEMTNRGPNVVTATDNWDQHWTDFAETPDYSPAVAYRRRVIKRMLAMNGAGQGRRLIELGCGSGQFAREFCPQFPEARFLGLDISDAGIQQARRQTPRAQFEVCNLLEPVTGKSIRDFRATDAICSEVLEHVDEPKRILENAAAAMAPGCRLLVTVPGGPMNKFDKHIGHRRHYRPQELRDLLTAAGYLVEKTAGFGFPFHNLYRLVLWIGGSSVVDVASGPPSWTLQLGFHVFDTLCRLNVDCWGWQTIAIARWPGPGL